MKGKLSARQERILEFIHGFMDEHQFPPTVRDIQSGCDISSTSVVDYNLHILQREGYLRRLPEVSRGIELLDGYSRSTKRDTVSIPIVGSIAAGEPLHVPAVADRQSDEYETMDLPSSLTGGKTQVYGLRVKGDSMIDAFIADGDLVLMEPATDARQGEMVAAEIAGEEVTLKRFYLEGDSVRLQPENTTMEPIRVSADNVAIRGRVVGVIRSL